VCVLSFCCCNAKKQKQKQKTLHHKHKHVMHHQHTHKHVMHHHHTQTHTQNSFSDKNINSNCIFSQTHTQTQFSFSVTASVIAFVLFEVVFVCVVCVFFPSVPLLLLEYFTSDYESVVLHVLSQFLM